MCYIYGQTDTLFMDNISTSILAGALIIIMLGMGMSLEMKDFNRIIYYPKAILVGLVNQIVLLPLIGFSITLLFPMQPEIAIGIMILAACPGGPTSNLITHLAKGDLALSVSLTAVSSLITIITIPFVVGFALSHYAVDGQEISLNIFETIAQIFIIVVIPIAIGMFLRRFYRDFSLKMAKPVRIASGVVLAIIILGIIIKEKSHMEEYFRQAGIAAFILNIVTMIIGFYSAKFLKLNNPQAISISIESGIQNGTLAITVAVVLLGNSAFAIAPAVYSILMFLSGGVAIYFGSKLSKQMA